MFGFVGSNKILTSKLEWLDTLSTRCGVGLWDALLYEGDAMHPKARWTWSEEFRRISGYTTEKEFPNVVQSWSDWLHPDDASETFAAFGATCSIGVGYDVTYRLKVRDGSYCWLPKLPHGSASATPRAEKTTVRRSAHEVRFGFTGSRARHSNAASESEILFLKPNCNHFRPSISLQVRTRGAALPAAKP
jgi:hypothetical protein